MDAQLAAYLILTTILVLTPGATTAVVVRNTLAGGRTAGVAAAMGAAIGNMSHAAAAGLGLALMFSRLPWTMMLLRVGGGAFLGWLGARAIYNVLRDPAAGHMTAQLGATVEGRGSAFRQGVFVNLLNPAIATFYLAVVPSFQRPDSPEWYFAALAAIHVLMAFLCHGAWAFALHRLRRLLAR